MNKRVEHWLQIVTSFIVLLVVMIVLLYFASPGPKSGPQIKVIYLIEGDNGTIIKEIPQTDENSVIVNRKDVDNESVDGSITLQCNAGFSVVWKYEGYGMPSVKVTDERLFRNYEDITTYSYSSSLHMMTPLSEKTSGRYLCEGVLPEFSSYSSTIQLFVPGEKVFVIQQDITLESDIAKELLIPCHVSDPVANISLLLKGDRVGEEFIKSFQPTVGFVLNAKFLEERDPLATFICRDDKTKQKSGRITISTTKDSRVRAIPKTEEVTFTSDFDGTFICQAKENITIKFRRILKPQPVEFSVDLSSEFGFQAKVTFVQEDIKDGTIVSCVTTGTGQELHSWKIAGFSSQTQEVQTTKLSYDEEQDEFACCGTLLTRPKLKKISCHHPIECGFKQRSCPLIDPNGVTDYCRPDPIKLYEKSSCLRYKVEYKEDISSGYLQCITGPETTSFNYVNTNANDTIVSSVLKYDKFFDTRPTDVVANTLLLASVNPLASNMTKLICKAPAFIFSEGIVWQTVRVDGATEYISGKDSTDGPWIKSEIEVNNTFNGSRKIRKCNCIAPLWNSNNAVGYHSVTLMLDGV